MPYLLYLLETDVDEGLEHELRIYRKTDWDYPWEEPHAMQNLPSHIRCTAFRTKDTPEQLHHLVRNYKERYNATVCDDHPEYISLMLTYYEHKRMLDQIF